MSRSLGAQDLGGVGAQRAQDGGECRNQGSEQNGTGRQRDHIRVGGFDLVEERRDIACCAESERDAGAASERDHEEDIARDDAHDAGTRGANRHADTDLAAALEDGVVEDGVESDAGEEQRDGGKEGGEHGDEALANGLVADEIELGGDVGDAKAVAAPGDELAEPAGEGERVAGVGVNDEGGEGFEAWGRICRQCRKRGRRRRGWWAGAGRGQGCRG